MDDSKLKEVIEQFLKAGKSGDERLNRACSNFAAYLSTQSPSKLPFLFWQRRVSVSNYEQFKGCLKYEFSEKNYPSDEISFMSNLKDTLEEIVKKEPIVSEIRLNNEQMNEMLKAFDIQFECGNMFTKFEDYVKNCAQKWYNLLIHAPLGVVCQSSGHGKTRCMKEFARRNVSLFICLRKSDNSGVPGRSPIANLFLDLIQNEIDAIRFFYAWFKVALTTISELLSCLGINIQNIDDAQKEVLARHFFDYQPWHYFENNLNDCSKHKVFSEKIKAELSSGGNFDLDKSYQDLKTTFEDVMKEHSLFVFLDEAGSLVHNSGTKFKIMRKAIQHFFKKIRVAFILSDTNSKITNFYSDKRTMSESEKTAEKVYEPFYGVLYVDLTVPPSYLNELIHLTFDYFQKRDSMKTVFYYGRPLWSSCLNQNSSSLIELAAQKIMCALDWSNLTGYEKYSASLAIFSIRTSMLLNYHVSYSKDLVARHMATLFYISENREEITFKYIPEPILAQGAADLMSNKLYLQEMLQNLNKYTQTMFLESAGAVGEIIAELIILLAFDQAQKNSGKSYLSAITVEQFLKTLIGCENFEKFRSKTTIEMLESLICFNHFVRKFDDLSYRDTLNDFIGRGAAGQFKRKNIGFDLFIPCILKSNEISYIYIQVKNTESKLSASRILNYPDKCHFKDSQINKHFLPIIMSLGSEVTESEVVIGKDLRHTVTQSEVVIDKDLRYTTTNINKDYLVLSKISKKTYPFLGDEIINQLNRIAMCDRNLYNADMYDKDIFENVLKVSLSTDLG